MAGENQHHKTLMIPADEAAQASLHTGKIVESATIYSLKAGKKNAQWTER